MTVSQTTPALPAQETESASPSLERCLRWFEVFAIVVFVVFMSTAPAQTARENVNRIVALQAVSVARRKRCAEPLKAKLLKRYSRTLRRRLPTRATGWWPLRQTKANHWRPRNSAGMPAGWYVSA